ILVEGNICNKSSFSKTADWLLTPMRKGFYHNRTVTINKRFDNTIDVTAKQDPSSPTTILWKILAVSTIALGLIGYLMKCTSPTLIKNPSP
ncbi:MAG: hypothetical protein AAGG81_03660, partial [Chlamydiota bacterium]